MFLEDADRGLDGCHSMISLAANMHVHWNNGAFALKSLPLETDEDLEAVDDVMRVQFFWQPLYEGSRHRVDAVPATSQGLEASNGRSATCHTFNETGDRIIAQGNIRTGDVFVLSTADAERYPLPSRFLLDMQWKLQRVIAMSGAAESEQDEDDKDDGIDELGKVGNPAITQWLTHVPDHRDSGPSWDKQGSQDLSQSATPVCV